MADKLLEVNGLKKHFPVRRGFLASRNKGWIKAVDGVSFDIAPEETFGLVGESGCGKSTTARVILKLEEPSAGTVLFDGEDIRRMDGAGLKRYHASVQAVFQDPFSSLSPRMRVGEIISEPLVVNNRLPRHEVKAVEAQLLEQVGLRPDSAHLYPHEFSGGQRQRIAVARALALHPRLVVLDEPVSALDVSIRAQILNLLKALQEKMGLAYLLIAHDLAVVKHMSHRIGVMYLGKLVEVAFSRELYANRLHPYTQALFSATLPSHPDIAGEEIILPGEVPSPLNPPSGCHFHPRCHYAMPRCPQEEPLLRTVADGHSVACHLH